MHSTHKTGTTDDMVTTTTDMAPCMTCEQTHAQTEGVYLPHPPPAMGGGPAPPVHVDKWTEILDTNIG